MKVSLNQNSIKEAQMLINHHEVDLDASDWDECAPTPDEVDHFIDTHDMSEYGLWFLGLNHDAAPEVKEHYVYPIGDLKLVHRSALVMSRDKAAKANHKEIEQAAKQLLDLIDKKMPKK